MRLNAASGVPDRHTYLGGDGDDFGYDITVDADGNLIVTGDTENPGPPPPVAKEFPTLDAAQPNWAGGIDAFVAKLDPDLDLIYSTFVALPSGGGTEPDRGRAVAAANSLAYVAGYRGFTDHSYLSILDASAGLTVNSFTIDDCGSPACEVTGPGQIAIATVVLTSPLESGDTLVLEGGTGTLAFGAPVQDPFDVNTYTLTVDYTPSGPPAGLQNFSVQVILNSVPSLSLLINLAPPPAPPSIVIFDINNCKGTACVVSGPSVTPLATAIILTSDELPDPSALVLIGGSTHVTFGPTTPLGGGAYNIDIFPGAALASGGSETLNIQVQIDTVTSAVIAINLAGPSLTITSFEIAPCVSAACPVSAASVQTQIAMATVVLDGPLGSSDQLNLSGGTGFVSFGPAVPAGPNTFTFAILYNPGTLIPAGVTESFGVDAVLNSVGFGAVTMSLTGVQAPVAIDSFQIAPCVSAACLVTAASVGTQIATATVVLNGPLGSSDQLALTGGTGFVTFGPGVLSGSNTFTFAIIYDPATLIPPGGSASFGVDAELNSVGFGAVTMSMIGPPLAITSFDIAPCVSAACLVTAASVGTQIATATVVLNGPLGSSDQLALTGGTGFVTFGPAVLSGPNTFTFAIIYSPAVLIPPGGTASFGVDAELNSVAFGPVTMSLAAPIVFEAAAVNLTQTEVTGPVTITGNTVALNCPPGAPGSLVTVYLTAIPGAGVTIPATVNVPAGACVSETFAISVPAVTTAVDIEISASLVASGPAQASRTLTVNPQVGGTVLDFAVFGAGNRSNGHSTRIGKDVEVTGGLVGGNRKVVIKAASNVTGIRAGADVSVGQGAGKSKKSGKSNKSNKSDKSKKDGDDGDDGTLGLAQGIIAGRKVTLESKATVLGNIDGGQVRISKNANVGGNVVVAGKIDLKQAAIIDGDADGTRASLDRNATISGTLTLPVGVNPTGSGIRNGSATIGAIVNGVPQTPQPFSTIILPPATVYSASSARQDNVTVGRKATLTLAPGVYRDLKIKKGGTLNLVSGTYVFRKISSEVGVTLNMDVTSGDVEILVAGDVRFGRELEVNVAGGSAKNIYLETAGRFTTDRNSIWQGTVFSTKARSAGQKGISVGTKNRATGAFFSNQQIDVKDGSEVTGEIADAFAAKVTP